MAKTKSTRPESKSPKTPCAVADKYSEPLSGLELEDASLQVAQAAALARLLMGALGNEPDAQNVAAMLSEHLHEIASRLGHMEIRYSRALAQEARS